MMTDKSYTQISSAFDEVLCAYFPATASPAQVRALKKMFFTGAAVACGLMKQTPDLADTIEAEILDFSDRLEMA